MKDSLCLIPPEHILNDKSYGNLTEFALRTEDVRAYLCNSRANERACDGIASDYDILKSLVESMRRNGDKSSRVYRYFSRVLKNSFGIDAADVVSGKTPVDELWHTTAEVLLRIENTLCEIISRSSLESLGDAQTPWEYEKLPEKIGNAKISAVMCPLGARGKSILEIPGFDDFAMLERHINFLAASGDDCAVLLDELDFEFQEPNLYVASIAYDKTRKRAPLKNSERNVLKSQLLRDTFFACAQNGREIFVVLPNASNIKMLYQTEQLLDYIDESIGLDIKLALFAPDAVSFSFAYATAAKKYKKITADAAICGNDRYLMNDDDAMYWGVGRLPERMASLATTPAYLGKIICQNPFLFSDRA